MLAKKFVLLLIVLMSSLMSFGGIIYVTDGSDSGAGTLRDAVNSAGTNDTIIINYKGGFALFSPILVTNKADLTIIGPYAKHMFFTGDATISSIFQVSNSTNIVFENMGFWNNIVGAPIDIPRALDISLNSTVTVRSSLFERCRPLTGDGAAIRVRDTSGLTLVQSTFIDNFSTGNGGAVSFDETASFGNIQSNSFIRNEAVDSGGAVFIKDIANQDSFVLNNNTFYQNSAVNSTSANGGHAVYVNYPATASFFDFSTWFYFRNNLLYLNGFADQVQVSLPLPGYAGNFNAQITNNYYYAFNLVHEPTIPQRLKNNSGGPDYVGFELPSPTHTLGLKTSLVTDGYGLKYVTITDPNSFLIDKGAVPAGQSQLITTVDCRRAPRLIDGDTGSGALPDIGAAEFTPYQITGTPNANDWWDLISKINTSSTPSAVHYVEFDLTSASTEVPVHLQTDPIDRTVYIDGYSQNGSAIPGPNFVGGNSSDSLTPARNLVTFVPHTSGPNNAISLNNAPSSIVAGLSIIDFSDYGIDIGAGANGSTIFGNVIGVRSNVANNTAVSPRDGNELAGIRVAAENISIGGNFHHQRNVIVDNGFDAPNGAPDYLGSNIRLTSVSNDAKIRGNVIGIHPNGKDTIPLEIINNAKIPNGITVDGGANIEIGSNYLFGKNTIANHRGDGIFHENANDGTTISNNHIGVNFDGKMAFGNRNGIYLKDFTAAYQIGGAVRNIISANDSAGVRIHNGSDITIKGNIIGGDSTVTSTAFGNNYGVHVTGTSGSVVSPIVIGGDDFITETERNTIVNNTAGINLSGSNVQEVRIGGNLIGVPDHSGTLALPNTDGIIIQDGSHDNFIGYNPSSGLLNQRNIISGNTNSGIWLNNTAVGGNIIASNIIGATIPTSAGAPLDAVGNKYGVLVSNVTGSATNFIGNENDSDQKLVIVGNEVGVEVQQSIDLNVFNTIIGVDENDFEVPNVNGINLLNSANILIGGALSKSNIISGNDSVGIYIEASNNSFIVGNKIGTNNLGDIARPNFIGVRIKGGQDIDVGGAETNVISGNYYGLILQDSAFNNVITNNYFGLAEDGISTVSGSYFGIIGNNLPFKNDIGRSTGVTNYFANDSIDISLQNSRGDHIVNNVIGYGSDETTILGAVQTGIGIRLANSKKINVGSPAALGRNSIANKAGGLVINEVDSCQIQNTFFGTTPAGTSVNSADNQRFGIINRSGKSDNNTFGPNNIFGGNNIGILLSAGSEKNLFFKNYFGVDSTLMNTGTSFENDTAMIFTNANRNIIGSVGDSTNQMINYNIGVYLRNAADSNKFSNNYIGFTSSGLIGTNSSDGVLIDSSFANRFGSTNPNPLIKNRIAHNDGDGIKVINDASGNAFFRNEIFSNGGLAIDANANSISPVGEVGIQNEMHTPILQTVHSCASTSDIDLVLIANGLQPGDTYYIDVYNSNGFIDQAQNYGEAKTSVYFDNFTATGTSDTVQFDLSGLPGVSVGDSLVGILTQFSTFSSSEVGEYAVVLGPPSNAVTVSTQDEPCATAQSGGIITVDNTVNSSYSYSASIAGVEMTLTSPNIFEVDSLAVGSYTVDIDYITGCQNSYTALLNTGPTFQIDTSTVADTCGLNTGLLELTVISNNITGFTFLDTLYSFDGGSSFGQNSVVNNLAAGSSFVTGINLVVTNGVVTETCPSSNSPVVVIPSKTLSSELDFTYNDFCSDGTGTVTVPPSFTQGTYSLTGSPVTLNSMSGEISGASDNDMVFLQYNYGTCSTAPAVQVTALATPDPTFTMDDFCANSSSSVPVSVTAGGLFSLDLQPVGPEVINGGTGLIQTSSTEFTTGNYRIIYQTLDPNCPREDTVVIEVFSSPSSLSFTTAGNTFAANPIDVDSISFCPNLGINEIIASSATTNWIEPDGNTIVGSSYTANLLADDSTYTLNYFYTVAEPSANPSTLECQTDPDSLIIQIYAEPVRPIITNANVAYCEDEVVSLLEIGNNTSTNAVNWYLDGVTTSDLVQSNNNNYGLFGPIDNLKKTIFAQDSTGLGCYSERDTAELIFFENPSNVNITFLAAPLANGATIFPCPTSIDSIIANSAAANTFWNSTASGLVNDSLFVPSNQFLANTVNSLEFYKDSSYSTGFLFGPSTKVCESDRDTITVDMLRTPVKPSIVNGDSVYCFGEPILNLFDADSLLTNNILWYENTVADVNFIGTPSNSHSISSNILYNNASSSIFARDSTGEDCYSEYDTTEITLHTLPPVQQLFFNTSNTTIASLDTIDICPSVDLLDSIRASTPQLNTYWELGQNGLVDTAQFYDIVSAPLAFDTLIFYRDTLYTLSGKVCESVRDTIFIDMLSAPLKPNLADTAYCENEIIAPLTVSSAAQNLIWIAHNETVVTTPAHSYQPVASSFNYVVDLVQVYDSTGVTTSGKECLSEIDSVSIAYHPKPNIGTVNLLSTASTASSLIEVCPTSVDSLLSNIVMAANSTNFWLSGGVETSAANFGLNNFPDNSILTVFNYRDTTTNLLNLANDVTCLSDTISFQIQTFNTPVQPMTGNVDLAYCFGETVDSLAVMFGTSVIWTETGASSTTLAPSEKYLPTIPGVYNYEVDTITVQDFTGTTTAGIACVSDLDTIRIAYHAIPDFATIDLQSDGLPVGDTVFICPTTVDSLVASSSNNESFWYTSLGVDLPGNTFGLNDFADNSDNTVFYYRDTTVNLTVPLTCYSDTNSVVVRTYQSPITPSITSGGLAVDTVLYCTDNLVDNLGLLTPTDSVNWYQPGLNGSFLFNSNNYSVSAPATFTGQTQVYVAYDSTGINCFSANDSIVLLFHPRPDAPILSTADNEYCEGDAIADIFANDIGNSPVISDWFLNDSTTTALSTGSSQITPVYGFANDTTYTYYAQTESAIGCKSYFSQVGVSFHPTPALPAINYTGPGLEYCPEDDLDTLISDSTMTWFYQSNINITVVTDTFDLNTMPINTNTQDVVNYFYTDEFNCFSDIGFVPIEVFAIPEVPVLSSADSTYCIGDLNIAPFDATNGSGGSLGGVGSWFDLDGNLLSSGGANSFSYGYLAPLSVGDTTIIFNYLNLNGCLSENDTLSITTFPTPATPQIITSDSVYCQGEVTASLNEAGGTNTNWYFVVNGTSNLQLTNSSVYTPTDSGTYIAQTFENDCPSLTDSIEIIINQLPTEPIITNMPIEFCEGQQIDTIRIQNGTLGFWYESNNLNNPLAVNSDFFWTSTTIIDSAQYFVNNYDPVTDCYSEFDSITLYQFIHLGDIATESAEVCLGFTIDLEAEGGITYLWSNADTTSFTTVAPTSDTWYYVDIIDSNNCFLQDSVEVRMKMPASCQEEIYTAFSPNGDGVNEVWEITGIEKYDEPIVYIFNRWGDQIAKIENYDNGVNVWDGTNQQTGQPVVYGTYYYIVEDGTKKVRDGWLQVVK